MREIFLTATLLVPNFVTVEPLDRLAELYLGGQQNEAVAGLAALDQEQTKAQASQMLSKLTDLIRDESHGAPLFKAAVMLFTDRALVERAAGRIGPYWHNLDIAVAFVNEASSVRSCASCQSFARRWYLLAGLECFGTVDIERSRFLFENGLKQFPSDSQLLLALGTLEENLGSTRIYGPPPGRGSALDAYMEQTKARVRHLGNAARYFRKALAFQSELSEARLRLGRVLFLQRDDDSAYAEFEAVEHAAGDAETRYLAALFQGRVHERQRRLPQAAEAYGRASGYLPSSPTACIALARALDVVGDRAKVPDLLDRALQRIDRTPLQDPWWTYLMGQFWKAEPLHRDLQSEVRR